MGFAYDKKSEDTDETDLGGAVMIPDGLEGRDQHHARRVLVCLDHFESHFSAL
jgi:hypothetical protein